MAFNTLPSPHSLPLDVQTTEEKAAAAAAAKTHMLCPPHTPPPTHLPALLLALFPEQACVGRAGYLKLVAVVGAGGILGAGHMVAAAGEQGRGREGGCRRPRCCVCLWKATPGKPTERACRSIMLHQYVLKGCSAGAAGRKHADGLPAVAAGHAAAHGGAAPPAVGALHQPPALDGGQHIPQRAVVCFKHLFRAEKGEWGVTGNRSRVGEQFHCPGNSTRRRKLTVLPAAATNNTGGQALCPPCQHPRPPPLSSTARTGGAHRGRPPRCSCCRVWGRGAGPGWWRRRLAGRRRRSCGGTSPSCGLPFASLVIERRQAATGPACHHIVAAGQRVGPGRG